jgi:hypothetical protein
VNLPNARCNNKNKKISVESLSNRRHNLPLLLMGKRKLNIFLKSLDIALNAAYVICDFTSNPKHIMGPF